MVIRDSGDRIIAGIVAVLGIATIVNAAMEGEWLATIPLGPVGLWALYLIVRDARAQKALAKQAGEQPASGTVRRYDWRARTLCGVVGIGIFLPIGGLLLYEVIFWKPLTNWPAVGMAVSLLGAAVFIKILITGTSASFLERRML